MSKDERRSPQKRTRFVDGLGQCWSRATSTSRTLVPHTCLWRCMPYPGVVHSQPFQITTATLQSFVCASIVSCFSAIMKLEELRFTFTPHFHSLSLLVILYHTYFSAASDHLQQDQPQPAQYLTLAPQLSRPIALLILLLFFVFFIIVFLSVYLRHYLELNAASDAVLRAAAVDRFGTTNGLDPVEIRTFPEVARSVIKETKIGKWSLECAVCLSEFQDYEALRLLPECGHVFHPSCIDAWLASRATCPICRAKLRAPENSPSEFVAISVVDEVDGNGDEDEAVETSNGEACEMDLGGARESGVH